MDPSLHFDYQTHCLQNAVRIVDAKGPMVVVFVKTTGFM